MKEMNNMKQKKQGSKVFNFRPRKGTEQYDRVNSMVSWYAQQNNTFQGELIAGLVETYHRHILETKPKDIRPYEEK